MDRFSVFFVCVCGVIPFCLLTASAGFAQAPSGPAVVDTRCEMQSNPLGIDVPTPRLSWVIQSDRRATRQVAYHVRVASSADQLLADKADLWDSGKVMSDESLHVPYAGKALLSNQIAFWSVKVWTNHDQASEWSEPSSWTMGLLDASEWRGQWIGTGADLKRLELGPARWICFPAENPERQPVESWVFRRTIDLPAGVRVRRATLSFRGDNDARFELDGREVANGAWSESDCTDAFKEGARRELRVTVTNWDGPGPNPAGLIARLSVEADDGRTIEICTDRQWTVARAAQPDHVEPAQELGDADFKWWHGTSELGRQTLPILRREIELEKPVRRVLLHVAGLGQYRLMVNGQPARRSILDQDWSSYEKTVFYDSYDVTSLINGEKLCLGVLLAKGNYSNVGDRRIHVGVRHRPLALRLQGTIEYADGSSDQIASDENWRWLESPYTHSAIVGGADYDARLLPDGWSTPGFDDSQWHRVSAVDWRFGKLVASRTPPLRAFEAFGPQTIEEPAPGHFVYDFVQNSAATVRLKVKGRSGQTIRLTYGEQRHGATDQKNNGKGLVNQAGIGQPNYIEYTCRGDGEETWLCDLFYSGFQYVELTGGVPAGHANPDDLPVVSELTSLAVRADVEAAGRFACSDPLLERIDRMIDWAVKSNLSYVLTDCPQREKFGWLEVPHLMWPSLVAKYDLSRFGPKICRDIRDTQAPDGRIVNIAPTFLVDGYHFNGVTGIGYTIEWGAAGVLIPWYVYSTYGDRQCLAENYDGMKAFVDYIRSTADADLVPPDGGLGDWYDYGHGGPLGPSRFTPSQLTAMAVFHDCARRVADAAEVLDKPADADAYRRLASDIAARFNAKYLDAGTAQYKNFGSCQTANAIAIACGIVPKELVPRLIDAIVVDLEARDFQQTSGDVGFHYLIRALADNGRSDVLYRILKRTDVGSYGFLANNGWSALPEAWNADTNSSMNHCMLGHIEEFFAQDIGGVKPIDGAVAFKSFAVRPAFAGGPASASYRFRGPYGLIQSEWTQGDGRIDLNVTVPVNAEALVFLPASDSATHLTEGGKPLDEAPGILAVRFENGTARIRVGSGAYSFSIGAK